MAKKFIFLPLILLMMFFSTFFVSGCFCGVKGDTIPTRFLIENPDLNEEESNFKKLIGYDKNSKESGYLKGIALALLGTASAGDEFATKLKEAAEEIMPKPEQRQKFLQDFVFHKTRFVKISAVIDSSVEVTNLDLPPALESPSATEENQTTKVPEN